MNFMHRILHLFACMILGHTVIAQVSLILTPAANEDPTLKCYEFQMTSTEALKNHRIGSQNIRLYYDSSKGKLNLEKSISLLSSDEYYFGITQHLKDLDASGVGTLPFEKSLGFINAAMVLNNTLTGGISFDPSSTIAIAQFCFEIETSTTGSDIPLAFASSEKTASYGRAFNEISAISKEDQLINVHVLAYIVE